MKELKMYNGGKVPQFCYRCGRQLEFKRKFSNYNSVTGEEEYHYLKYCPVIMPELRGHQVEEFDNDGNETIHFY